MLQAPASKLVGRATEFGRLTRVLDQAAAEEPVVALVSGDAGMGKTRLVAELATVAAARGFMVLYGRCAELGDSVPYLPLADALPMIFRGTGDCTKVLWRFLGLSIAEWALIWFAIFMVAAIVAAAMKPKRLRMFGP